MRRLPDARTLLALILVVITVGSVVSLYVSWRRTDRALNESRSAQTTGRLTRKQTDYQFCKAINRVIAINNRDRGTFIRSRVETKKSLTQISDPVLRMLLERSLVENARELAVRPKVKPLPCVAVIQHPTAKLPKGIDGKLPTTTTG